MICYLRDKDFPRNGHDEGGTILLKVSCHCGSVRFGVNAAHPYPFLLCYCSICRKTAGTGGYGINLGADFSTLKVEGMSSSAFIV